MADADVVRVPLRPRCRPEPRHQRARLVNKSVWNTAASKKALGDIKTLINAGAFGPSKSWDSVKFTQNQTAEMMVGGVSGLRADGLVGLLHDELAGLDREGHRSG